MCGIAGYITKKKYLNFSFKTTTNKLKNLMERRGPDQQGSFEHNFNDKSVNLFSSRLSIIDLDKRSDLNNFLKKDPYSKAELFKEIIIHKFKRVF